MGEFIANAVHEVANDLPIVLGVLDQKDTSGHAASCCSWA
jgi:hypothetical protein